MAERRAVPRDTNDTLAASQPTRWLNYGLRLERLLSRDGQKWELTKQAKQRQGVSNFNQEELSRLLNAHKERWEAMCEDCWSRGYIVRKFVTQAENRVIVGLGADSVLETSLRLHRVYGFPVIPGSALKGLARSCSLWQLCSSLGVAALSTDQIEAHEKFNDPTPVRKLEAYLDETQRSRLKELLGSLKNDPALPNEAPVRQMSLERFEEKVNPLRSVFGTKGSKGTVTFFDGIPTKPINLKLELDVMNPHYSEYYMGKEVRVPPADYLNPVPVYFLTLAPGSEFFFAAASKDARLAQQAAVWLRDGLTEMGVGAKTVAGYGYFAPAEITGVAPGRKHVTTLSSGDKLPSRSTTVEPPEVRTVQLMPLNQVAPRIRQYYDTWKTLRDGPARRELAEAILKKIQEAHLMKKWKSKDWVKELQEFVTETES